MEEALKSINAFRELMNEGRVEEKNSRITDDFFAAFSFIGQTSIETYNAEEYRKGNVEAKKFYEGKQPHWAYKNLGWGSRSENEMVFSSQITFSLNHEQVMKAFCIEIYRKEGRDWKLARQYMEKYKEVSRSSFQTMHDEYLLEWERAMAGGDCSKLEEFMAADYYVTFFMRNEEKPVFFDRREAIEGMKDSIIKAEKAEKRFENRVIRMKNQRNAIVFYEQVLVKDGEELARLFTTENWREASGRWQISREVQEHVG